MLKLTTQLLLVEDNIDQKELTLRAFRKKDPSVRIIAVENGSAALEILRRDHFDAVILDDLGYVQQGREEMEVLFTFLAERYERRSVLLSSNLVFSKWDQVFKDPMTTMAAVDRLVHHAVILEFDNESVRATQAKSKAAGKNGAPSLTYTQVPPASTGEF